MQRRSDGGVRYNAAGNTFTNAGELTFEPDSGAGATLDSGGGGTILNTGTMNFNQNANLRGVFVNKGSLNIANGKTVSTPRESCGAGLPIVFNDAGGSINATGNGTLNATNYEQGAGTTTGTAPVTADCGTLKYVGSGASTVRVNTSTTMTGDLAAGQTLEIAGQVGHSAPLANAGTIALLQSSATLGSPAVTNTGTVRGSGAILGSVINSGGVVKPGESPGTLTFTGSYTQEAGGRLEIEIADTGAGQFDALAVGGNATLSGTLALIPIDGYAGSAAMGDSVAFLGYGGTLAGQFATTTVSPSLTCPKQMTVSSDTGAKVLKATVTDSGSTCSSGNGGGDTAPPPPPPPPAPVPNTKLGVHPGPRVTTKLKKLKVKFGFSSDVAGASFECKLDKGAFKPCKSPATFKVKPGQHTFKVRAVGPGGADASPVTYKFKVIKQKG